MCSAAGVGARQHFPADSVAGIPRQLLQRLVQHGLVVGGGIGTGVAWAEQRGGGFAGAGGAVVDEREQRVKAPTALVGWGRVFLEVAVGVEQGRVQVDDQRAFRGDAVVGGVLAGGEGDGEVEHDLGGVVDREGFPPGR